MLLFPQNITATMQQVDGIPGKHARRELRLRQCEPLTSLQHGQGSSPLQQIIYGLDANGNRTQLTDGDGVRTNTCDELNRLTSASYPAITCGPAASTVPYGYDEVGNRTSDGTTPSGTIPATASRTRATCIFRRRPRQSNAWVAKSLND